MTATEIVKSIVDAFSGVLQGMSSGIVDLFQTLFMNATTSDAGVVTYTGISPLGIWTLAFIGVGAALSILRAVKGKVLAKG